MPRLRSLLHLLLCLLTFAMLLLELAIGLPLLGVIWGLDWAAERLERAKQALRPQAPQRAPQQESPNAS